MITALKLGNITFASNLIQGPLAGVSNAPFRKLLWRYSKPAFACTEMISCKTLIHQSDAFLKRFVHKDISEGPLCFQLSGNDPKEVALATKKATSLGADLIDLNCGCPVKKIRSKYCGSQLLANPLRIYELITAMKQNTHVPISIKIRVDGTSGDQFNRDIANAVNDAGADYLIVHGRHWSEQYEVACRYDQIAFFVENMQMPVIGNGDVACSISLQKMLETGCQGVMVGRASVGQPWLLTQLTNQSYQSPTLYEIGELYIEHITDLIELLNGEKFALLQARNFAKYYARHMRNKNEFCLQVNECQNFRHFLQICQDFFKD